MKIKHLILIAVVMLSADLFSQSFQYYEYKDIDGIDIKYVTSNMIADDGSVFITANKTSGGTLILKLTEEGEIDESKYINLNGSNGHRGHHPFFSHPYMDNTNVYVYVTHSEGHVPTYNAVFFDNNLNVIKQVSNPLYTSKNLVYSEYESYLLDTEGNIIVRVGDGSDNTFLFVKMDIDGNILNEKEVVFETKQAIFGIPYYSLSIYNEEPLQYAFMVETHNNYKGLPKLSFMVLDSDFNVLEVKDELLTTDLPYSHRYNMLGLEDSYITSTNHFCAGYPSEFSQIIRLNKFDKEHNLLNTYEYKLMSGYNVFSPVLAYRNIIPAGNGDIYWIYLLEGVYDKGHGSLCVSRFDKDLNLKWEQKIKVMRFVDGTYIYSAVVRDNGDLVFSGGIAEVGDLLLFTTVVKNDGEILDVSENAVGDNPFTLYPNPAGDNVSVRFAEGADCEMVEIYSLDGRRCHAQNFNLESIDLSGLSSGVYMMKVVMDNGEVFTEKIAVK